jgi:hypothetical protein
MAGRDTGNAELFSFILLFAGMPKSKMKQAFGQRGISTTHYALTQFIGHCFAYKSPDRRKGCFVGSQGGFFPDPGREQVSKTTGNRKNLGLNHKAGIHK